LSCSRLLAMFGMSSWRRHHLSTLLPVPAGTNETMRKGRNEKGAHCLFELVGSLIIHLCSIFCAMDLWITKVSGNCPAGSPYMVSKLELVQLKIRGAGPRTNSGEIKGQMTYIATYRPPAALISLSKLGQSLLALSMKRLG